MPQVPNTEASAYAQLKAQENLMVPVLDEKQQGHKTKWKLEIKEVYSQ